MSDPLILTKFALLVPNAVDPTSGLPVGLGSAVTVVLAPAGSGGAPTKKLYLPHSNVVFPLPEMV